MDGNRTHPGRLSSAPQTVLKTGGPASTTVRWRPHRFGHKPLQSIIVRLRSRSYAGLAVFLAVSDSDEPEDHVPLADYD